MTGRAVFQLTDEAEFELTGRTEFELTGRAELETLVEVLIQCGPHLMMVKWVTLGSWGSRGGVGWRVSRFVI